MIATNRRTLAFLVLVASAFAVTAGAGQVKNSQPAPPAVHHILLEVSNMQASLKFYRDVMGLRPNSLGKTFSTLETANIGIYLSTSPWVWKAPRRKGDRLGLGMYPHFEVSDVKGTVGRTERAGYRIVQEPKKHSWGTEAFVADPDGYTWALISLPH